MNALPSPLRRHRVAPGKNPGQSARRMLDLLDTLRGDEWWTVAALTAELGWPRQSVRTYLYWLRESEWPVDVMGDDKATSARAYRWQP